MYPVVLNSGESPEMRLYIAWAASSWKGFNLLRHDDAVVLAIACYIADRH